MQNILVVGSLNMDTVANVDHIPRVGETVTTNTIRRNPGGKGANQAYAVGRLGGHVRMLGAVGDDATGQELARNLGSVGVDTDGILIKQGVPSGQAFISVNKEGDNSIVVISGANDTLSVHDIERHLGDIAAADIVMMQLEIRPEVVLYTARKAKELGRYVILDPAPVQPDIPDELFRYVDLIKPNETELSMLTGVDDVLNHLQEATDQLRERGVRNVLVTLGGEGAYLNSEAYGIVRVPGRRVHVVDTTAAGDAFTAAVAYGLAAGMELPDAIELANRVSAIVVTRAGAQQSIPSMEDV